jgi:hypothetical protein
MRPLLPGDLDCAARALFALPSNLWAAEATRLVQAADIADRYRKRLGRIHRTYGDGSLQCAALFLGHRGQPRWCDDTYCAALAAVLTALRQRRTHHRR